MNHDDRYFEVRALVKDESLRIKDIVKQTGYDKGHVSRLRKASKLDKLIADAVAAEREKSLRLWMLLDDVDTADDIAKADHEVYRSLCRKAHQKRWEILSEAEVDAAIRARGNT